MYCKMTVHTDDVEKVFDILKLTPFQRGWATVNTESWHPWWPSCKLPNATLLEFDSPVVGEVDWKLFNGLQHFRWLEDHEDLTVDQLFAVFDDEVAAGCTADSEGRPVAAYYFTDCGFPQECDGDIEAIREYAEVVRMLVHDWVKRPVTTEEKTDD